MTSLRWRPAMNGGVVQYASDRRGEPGPVGAESRQALPPGLGDGVVAPCALALVVPPFAGDQARVAPRLPSWPWLIVTRLNPAPCTSRRPGWRQRRVSMTAGRSRAPARSRSAIAAAGLLGRPGRPARRRAGLAGWLGAGTPGRSAWVWCSGLARVQWRWPVAGSASSARWTISPALMTASMRSRLPWARVRPGAPPGPKGHCWCRWRLASRRPGARHHRALYVAPGSHVRPRSLGSFRPVTPMA
jgi:hypothetical protein